MFMKINSPPGKVEDLHFALIINARNVSVPERQSHAWRRKEVALGQQKESDLFTRLSPMLRYVCQDDRAIDSWSKLWILLNTYYRCQKKWADFQKRYQNLRFRVFWKDTGLWWAGRRIDQLNPTLKHVRVKFRSNCRGWTRIHHTKAWKGQNSLALAPQWLLVLQESPQAYIADCEAMIVLEQWNRQQIVLKEAGPPAERF